MRIHTERAEKKLPLMTKYIRSTQKLMTFVNEIFAASQYTLDTRAIVLLLAGTMPNNKFIVWIDEITALNLIKEKCKAINRLQKTLGTLGGKYILFMILKKIDRDLNSHELQQFISSERSVRQDKHLQPALIAEKLSEILSVSESSQQLGFIEALHYANQFFLNNFSNIGTELTIEAIPNVYVQCRQYAAPEVAFMAIIHSISDILMQSGLATRDAMLHSHRIVKFGLKQLIHIADENKTYTYMYDRSVTALTTNGLR